MKKVLLMLLFAATGCGGMPRCAQRSGTVQVYMAAKSGTCPSPIISRSTFSSQPTTVPSGCAGTLDTSADNCEVTMDAVCPNGDGSVSHLSGTVSWNEQGTEGKGVLSLAILDQQGGVADCQGTYDATYTKL